MIARCHISTQGAVKFRQSALSSQPLCWALCGMAWMVLWLLAAAVHADENDSSASIWVIDEIIEIRNDERWERENRHPSYQYEYSSGHGSFSVTTTHHDPTRRVMTPPMIGGESITLNGRFSAPPPKLVPGDQLALGLELSASNNTLSVFAFHAQASAELSMLEGHRRRQHLQLTDAKGQSTFQIRKDQDNYAPVSALLTGLVPTGVDERRLVIQQNFTSQAPMHIQYVYRWRNADVAVPEMEDLYPSPALTTTSPGPELREPTLSDVGAELVRRDDDAQTRTQAALDARSETTATETERHETRLMRALQSDAEPVELPAELAALAREGRLSVRALRAWGMLPERFSQLALELRRHDIDLLSADQAMVSALADSAADAAHLAPYAGELEALARLLSGFAQIDPGLDEPPATEAVALAPALAGMALEEEEPRQLLLAPGIHVAAVLPPGWESDERVAGIFSVSTEADGGRSIRIVTLNATRYLSDRRLFADRARLETWRGSVLGQDVTFVRGQTRDVFSPTISRTFMRGTRVLALADLCLPNGDPFTIELVSGGDFAQPEDDPELTRMLDAITLEVEPELQPCSPALATSMIAQMGAADAVATVGEKGFKRVKALGLSIALPEQMDGRVDERGMQFINGPDRLIVRLTRVMPESGEIRPAALAEMNALGNLELGTAGVFDLYQRSQTGLWRRDYSIHETWAVSRDRFQEISGDRSIDLVTHLVIRNEGDGLPDWDQLAPLHARMIELLRAAEDDS